MARLRPFWWVLAGAAALLMGFLALQHQRQERNALNDQNVRRAVEESGRLPLKICLPSFIDLSAVQGLPISEESTQQVNDLVNVGLVEADTALTTTDQIVLRATPMGQPFVADGKLCLAQAQYGQLKSLADPRITGQSKMINAKITPVLQPLPGVDEAWLNRVQFFQNVRGMDAELVLTPQGWHANSVSLY